MSCCTRSRTRSRSRDSTRIGANLGVRIVMQTRLTLNIINNEVGTSRTLDATSNNGVLVLRTVSSDNILASESLVDELRVHLDTIGRKAGHIHVVPIGVDHWLGQAGPVGEVELAGAFALVGRRVVGRVARAAGAGLLAHVEHWVGGHAGETLGCA